MKILERSEDPEMQKIIDDWNTIQEKKADGTLYREYKESKLLAMRAYFDQTAPTELLNILEEDEKEDICRGIMEWSEEKTANHPTGRHTSGNEETRKILQTIKVMCRENKIKFYYREKEQ